MSKRNFETPSVRLPTLEMDNCRLRESVMAIENALATSRTETKIAMTDLLASVTALATSRAETKVGAAGLLASATALATSRAETKVGVAEMLATTSALSLLRESESRSQILLHSNVTEALYLLDPDGIIETWNVGAERIKGYAEAEIIGRNFALFFTPEDIASGEPARVLAAASEKGHFMAESWRIRKDGSRFMARVAISPVHRDDGTLRGFVKVTRDITKELIDEARRDELSQTLAHARDRAEEASLAKTRFLAAITHDLRTPLHGILGYVELLCLDGDLSPTQLTRLDAITAAGQYLLGTINSVLDISQFEADRVELRPIEIDLHDFVQTCFDVVRPKTEAKGLTLVLATTSASLRLYADSTRLQQVIINLLGNAVKFTPAGSVEVRLQPLTAGEGIRLEVADTGPGIGEGDRHKLFQTFERINTNVVSNIEGSGLGLAISARLVHLMGGEIGYADNPGGGSVFWVELPSGAVPSPAVAVAAPLPSAQVPRLRVLVVDDEAMNRSIAIGFLRNTGYEVVCLDNGAAAVKAAEASDFDVILMDVRMPVMDGLEATRRIRALPPPRGQIRVVAMTAHAFAQQIDACRLAGMNSHLAKPFKQAALLAELEKVIVERGVVPPVPATADAAPKLPIFDRAAFEEVTEFVSAADLEQNLSIVITRAEALLSALTMTDMRSHTAELAEAAHKFAGGTGTLGFLSVAAAARQFEVAADMHAPETVALAGRLAVEIKASIPIVQRELVAMAAIMA